jgi:hypothetical protein
MQLSFRAHSHGIVRQWTRTGCIVHMFLEHCPATILDGQGIVQYFGYHPLHYTASELLKWHLETGTRLGNKKAGEQGLRYDLPLLT